MILKDKSKKAIKTNNKCIGELMILFDRGQKTIEMWLDADDIRFTTPSALEILERHTGMNADELFEPVTSA